LSGFSISKGKPALLSWRIDSPNIGQTPFGLSVLDRIDSLDWKQRRWRAAFGAIVAGLIVAGIPMIIDPAVYFQFIDMYRFPGRSTPFELPARASVVY
jgi:hypothetical protein